MSDSKRKLEDWWMPDQVELVHDSSRNWRKETFKTTVGVWHLAEGGRLLSKAESGQEAPEGATLDNAAWDHEHCALCFETISDQADYQREGYTDGNSWLCISCYETYISPYKPIEGER